MNEEGIPRKENAPKKGVGFGGPALRFGVWGRAFDGRWGNQSLPPGKAKFEKKVKKKNPPKRKDQ